MHADFEESYKHQLRSARMPTREGFLYEPRAYWSYGRYDTANPGSGRPPGVVVLPKDHFYNGESYPVTLLYALIAPLNYVFDAYQDAAISGVADYRNCGAAALNDAQLMFSMRQRQHYARIPGLLRTLSARPTWDPEYLTPDGAVPAVDRSSPFNTYAWDFDAAMVMPNRANLQFELGRYTAPGFLASSAPMVYAYVATTEIGALAMKGAMRVSPRFAVASTVGEGAYPGDGFGIPAGQPGQLWPPNQGLRARTFSAQNQSSDGSAPLTGIRVMIDQQEYDTQVAATAPAGTTASVVGPMGFRIPTRARTRQGGSGAWWWREGAPLALVSPSRTPAVVHELDCPLTLGPGDNLEVELTLPVTGEVNRITQVAVSFCGYAAIEG